ncbi:hypothetical protein GIB67_038909 [Kingdonia uniflora]|uniref:Uncharacterized protein n=1 Tax=Kingdonia uniflora TaxID=39325 RepID=A0A7J7LQI0_9MAGN|nr:hypothetical protein GIB67_038909 [Kingdonia uniflora]
MDDLPFQKITITGATLASIIQRFSSSSSDVDGLLFGHVSQPTPSNLLDDDDDSLSSSNSPSLVATITNYYCSGTISTFYDSLGRLNESAIRRFTGSNSNSNSQQQLLGWFVGRRRTRLRPSMRELAVSSSFSNPKALISLNNIGDSKPNMNLKFAPCVFVIFTTPLTDQLIHTHEHRAYQYRRSSLRFEPRSMDVVNIGPAFRVHYGAFAPNAQFPLLPRVAAGDMEVGEDSKSRDCLSSLRRVSKEQRGLDMCAEGFDVGKLKQLMGLEAARYTMGLEELYTKMLVKLEGLASLVEKSSAKVLEQEQRNIKLRNKVAGLE